MSSLFVLHYTYRGMPLIVWGEQTFYYALYVSGMPLISCASKKDAVISSVAEEAQTFGP